MILSFAVTNFRSFREEQTLSMVASSRYDDHQSHLASIPADEHQALPVAVLYGANGAGKSNLVKALSFLSELVQQGTAPGQTIPRQAFALGVENATNPTEMTLQFVEDGRVYVYGVRLQDRHVEAEWLSILRKGKEAIVFERVSKQDGEVVIKTGRALRQSAQKAPARVSALATAGVLPNQLFLHAVGSGLQAKDQGAVMAGAWNFFADRLRIIFPNASVSDFAGLVDDNSDFSGFADFAGGYLRRMATGVDRLRVETSELLEANLPMRLSFLKSLAKNLAAGEQKIISGPDGSQYILEGGEGLNVKQRWVKSEHLAEEGKRIALPFDEESDGTKRLAHLLPALYMIRDSPLVIVVDEIDRSLHPLLAKGFVRDFLESCAVKGSQLIFTTHETAFLDLNLLRRDEIWFAAKNPQEGATRLYSLSDYKVRTDLKIERAYLQGRFEAIPPVEAELPDWVDEIINELHRPALTTASSKA